MGVTVQAPRRVRTTPESARDLPRLRKGEAIVRCVERDGRLRVAWRAARPAVQASLLASFRATFPRHGDATFGHQHRVWSVPLSHQARLAEWISRHFHQDCELGQMPWDHSELPRYMTEARR